MFLLPLERQYCTDKNRRSSIGIWACAAGRIAGWLEHMCAEMDEGPTVVPVSNVEWTKGKSKESRQVEVCVLINPSHRQVCRESRFRGAVVTEVHVDVGRLDCPVEMHQVVGLVDAVSSDPVAEAMARAHSYAENAPPSLRFVKDLLTRNGSEPDLALVQQRELAALDEAYRTPEHREAVAAFTERRAPKFR